MAKARYHKGQRVFVAPVGTWAVIEAVVPHWAKGVEEPIRVTYDVSLGREFAAEELEPVEVADTAHLLEEGEGWRVVRGMNKWKTAEQCAHHPHPGSHPVVVTGDVEWGGWRVPGAEYDLNPARIEAQARMIAEAPKYAALLRQVADCADTPTEGGSNTIAAIIRDARALLKSLEN